MESIEVRGKTVQEAIELALKQLGLKQEEVEVTVIRESKSGILGIGSEQAIVEVTPITTEFEEDKEASARVGQEALQEILQIMDISATINVELPTEEEISGVVLNVVGDDLGSLIGRRGQTLSSLQQIVRLITSHRLKTWVPVSLDVEGYRRRRYASLKIMAQRLAEQVVETGKTITLEPMSSSERRIIHVALSDSPEVITTSIGEGEERKVVIRLKKKD